MNKILFSSNKMDWTTPKDFFEKLNREFNFTLDPCASKENALCKKFYTVQENGLLQNWGGERVFCNPPYGRKIGEWVKKCYEESLKPNTTIVLLIPNRSDTKWYHEYIHGKARVEPVKGRLKFGNSKNSAPFPSIWVVFGEKLIYKEKK